LRIPPKVVFSNGSYLSGEEVFLRGLFELGTGYSQYTIATIFGREQSLQSRAFNWFIDHIFGTFLYLLQDSLERWFNEGFVEQSNKKINDKLRQLGLTFEDDRNKRNNIAFFIDCNCFETCRVGGGPTEEGPNAGRWNDDLQRAFYNGWKSVHGLKHQTVDLAHGFTVDICGPYSLRNNDLKLLEESQLQERLATIQANASKQLICYVDSIYPHGRHILSCHRSRDNEDTLSAGEKLENKTLK